MGKLTDIEVVIIAALGVRKVLTTQELEKITGFSQRTVYSTLHKLRKKGLVRSNKVWKQSFLGLPMPDVAPTSPKEKVHMLTIDLELLWENPEFQCSASELFEAPDLEGLKRNFMKIQQRLLTNG